MNKYGKLLSVCDNFYKKADAARVQWLEAHKPYCVKKIREAETKYKEMKESYDFHSNKPNKRNLDAANDELVRWQKEYAATESELDSLTQQTERFQSSGKAIDTTGSQPAPTTPAEQTAPWIKSQADKLGLQLIGNPNKGDKYQINNKWYVWNGTQFATTQNASSGPALTPAAPANKRTPAVPAGGADKSQAATQAATQTATEPGNTGPDPFKMAIQQLIALQAGK